MSLKDEIRKYEIEVEQEAVKFIRMGYAPYEAVSRAQDEVRQKRMKSYPNTGDDRDE